ncbi:MAG: flagellar hook-length control protein FliK, partial [Deltaproteobacteria bacterium]
MLFSSRCRSSPAPVSLMLRSRSKAAAEVKVRGIKKRVEKYNILFALELAGFGRIRVDARLRTGSVTAVFYVDAEESLKRIDMELPRLRESLRAVGFREVLLA